MDSERAEPEDSPDQAASGSATYADQIAIHQTRLLHSRAIAAQIAAISVAFLLSFAAWRHASHRVIVGWLATATLVAGTRMALSVFAPRRVTGAAAARRWGFSYTVGAALGGATWGAATLLLYVQGSPAYENVLTFVVAGMVAGAAATNASHTPAFVAFALPAVTPLTLRLAHGADPEQAAMAGMVVVFVGVLTSTARAGARATASAVRTRISNLALRSEKRHAAEVARRANEAVRLVIASAPDPILLHANRSIVLVNPAAAKYLGYDSPDELVGVDPLSLVYPDDRPMVERRIVALANGARFESSPPQRLLRRDGSAVVAQFVSCSIQLEGRTVTLAAARDVTEWLRALEAQRHSEEQFRLTFEQAPIGMSLASCDGKMMRVNRALCDILGYGADELLELRFHDFTHPDDLAADVADAERLLRGEAARYSREKRFIRKDGRVVDARLHVSLIRNEAGQPVHFIAQVEDETERKRVRAELAERDRLASIGTLAAGVAHEINNPLSYVLSNLHVLAESLAHGPAADAAAARDALDMVREAQQGAERVRTIVQDLKTFSRRRPDQRRHVDVRDVVQASLRIAASELRHRARVIVDSRPVPAVDAEEARLVQVLVNLLVNAAQAIPEGHADDNEVRVTTRVDAGQVVVEVTDTGAGMTPDVVKHAFEPFFTTKPPGTGTGLGLSVCHGIVTSLGGEITVESAPGQGTTFRIALPAAPRVPVTETGTSDAPAHPSTASPANMPMRGSALAPPRPGGTTSVLVIDDDPAVGAAFRRALAREHAVTVMHDPRAALRRLLSGERYDVVICDLMMPTLSGMELYARIADSRPDQAERIIFATGGAFAERVREFLGSVRNARIEKPFDVEELRSVVRRASAA